MPSHRVLTSTVEEVPADVTAELGLPDGTRCRFLRRLFLADGKPVGLAETWLPLDVLGGHDALFERDRLDQGSMYETLQREPIGLVLDHAVETISPGVVDAPSAGLLGCDAGTPVLLIRRLTFTPDGPAGRVHPARLRRRALRVPGRAAPAGPGDERAVAPSEDEVRALVAAVLASVRSTSPPPTPRRRHPRAATRSRSAPTTAASG